MLDDQYVCQSCGDSDVAEARRYTEDHMFYLNNLKELAKTYGGNFVVIRDKKVLTSVKADNTEHDFKRIDEEVRKLGYDWRHCTVVEQVPEESIVESLPLLHPLLHLGGL